MAVDLTIALVSYNTRELLLRCLRSIYAGAGNLSWEVFVIDNGSHDGSVEAVREAFPGASVIANRDNRGYSAAANQALRRSQGRYFLLLNSDTVMIGDALQTMASFLDRHPAAGAANCKQWSDDRRLLRSCFSFPTLADHLRHSALMRRLAPWLPSFPGRLVDCATSQPVDWANGACLMLRRDLLDRLGGLDEGFFMYFEDVDLCRRIRLAGYEVWHVAEAEIVHSVGRSSGGAAAKLQLEWELSRIRYAEKHLPPVHRFLMKSWIAAGTVVRLLRLSMKRPAEGDLARNQWICLQRLWSTRLSSANGQHQRATQ